MRAARLRTWSLWPINMYMEAAGRSRRPGHRRPMRRQKQGCPWLSSRPSIPARNLLRRLVQAGMLDEDWQPADLSNAEKGILAWLLARRLKIENQWQTFSALWGMKTETLRTAYNRGMDQRRTGQFMERVKKVMGELGEEI